MKRRMLLVFVVAISLVVSTLPAIAARNNERGRGHAQKDENRDNDRNKDRGNRSNEHRSTGDQHPSPPPRTEYRPPQVPHFPSRGAGDRPGMDRSRMDRSWDRSRTERGQNEQHFWGSWDRDHRPNVTFHYEYRIPRYYYLPVPIYYHRFITDVTTLVIVTTIINEANRTLSPVEVAKKNGTYYQCRDEAVANFKAKYFEVYVNDFTTEPMERPFWIPRETICDGAQVFIVYRSTTQNYGFWDPQAPGQWIPYSIWNDDAVLDCLMAVMSFLWEIN